MAQYDGSIRINTQIDSKNAAIQLQSLENRIVKTADKIASLRSKMDSLKDVRIPTQEYVEVQRQIEATEKKINDLMARQEKFLATGGKESSSTYQKMQYDLEELRNSLPYLKGELQDLVDTGKAFTLGTNTEQYASLGQQLQYAENEMSVLNKRHSELITKQGTVAQRFSKMKDSAKKAFSAISSGTKKSSGLLSTFASRLKGLALSLLIFNWISKAFNSMISGMKTGFTNFMNYSDSFANSVQGMKNAMSTLGNQFAAAFSPIIQMIIPWLTSLINAISTAMTYVAQFIAILGGKSTFTRAKQVQDGYNKSLGGTAAAAKKAYGALAKFDDLDVLQKKEEDTGAGGAGAVGDMFEEVPVANKFKKLLDWLKDMWKNSDFYELGKWLGDQLAKMLANIPWDKIKSAARKLGKSLATLINGFIEGSFDGKAVAWWIGHTLAEAINTAFEFLSEFVHNLNWYGIGRFVADLINGFTQSIDWELIYDAFITAALGLGKAINAFVDNFDWDAISTTIANFVNTFSSTVYAFFNEVDWFELGNKIGHTIKETVEKIDFEEIGRALGSILHSAVEFVKGILSELSIKDVVDAIVDLFKGFFETATWEDIAFIILSMLELSLMKKAATWAFNTAVAAIATALSGAIGTSIAGIGTMEGVTTGFTMLEASLVSLVGDLAAATAAAFVAFDIIKNPLIDLLAELNGNTEEAIAKAEEMKNRYSGVTAPIDMAKDSALLFGNAIDGLPLRVQDFAALDDAMTAIGNGTIYTDEQLEALQERFRLTADDMEMLRQEMLDAHPELRNLADSFTELNTASAESLQEIYTGLQEMSNGIYDADDATAFLYGRFGDLTETTKVFFDNVSTGTTSIGEYQTSLENASIITKQFSEDIEEAGENIASGITEGFEKADVNTPVSGFFDRIKESLASVFGMHSPAKNMEPDGENILFGVLEGFKKNFGKVQEVVSEFFKYIGTSFAENMQNIPLFFSETWTTLYESTIETWSLIQEYFTEFWLTFIGQLTETWETILLLFTEKWEEIRLLFEGFIIFLNEIFLVSWLDTWTLAGEQYQTYHDLLTALTKAIQDMFTLFMKQIETLINTLWKNAWNNAKNIFSQFKNQVQSIANSVREIVQSLFDFVMELVAGMLAAIESVGNAAASISVGGGFAAAGESGFAAVSYSSQNFAAYTADLPHLASGSVIRGGNPFMAILGDQPRGQTNIEAPLPTIEQAVDNVLNRREYGMKTTGSFNPVIALNIDGEEIARLTLNDIFQEAVRQGYDMSVLGVT